MASDAVQTPITDIPAAVTRAIGLLATDPSAAATLAREILTLSPDNTDGRLVLGSSLRALGDPGAAHAILSPLADTLPASWVAQFELAQVLLTLGRSREAPAPLARAVGLNPGLAAGWRLLGDLQLIGGQVGAAQQSYDRLLLSVVPSRLRAAAEALAEGKLEAAERLLRAVPANDPAAAPAMHLLAETLARRGRLADAETLLTHALAAAPNLILARLSYALLLTRLGRHEAALAELDQVLARDPANQRARMARSAVLTELGDYAAAAAETASLLTVFPDQPRAWLAHAIGLRTLGRADEAIAAYRRCLELDPGCSEAWWSLANLKSYRFTPQARAAVEAALSAPDVTPEAQANLHFTLGKAAEDDGGYAEAFDHYARGNRIEHDRRAYDPALTTALVDASTALFTPAFFAKRAEWGVPAADPIFIVGLPRSGSTLVDQILASHPTIEGTRELHDIQAFSDWIAGPNRAQGYPAGVSSMPADVVAQLGRDYLSRTRPLRKLGRPMFIDKAPWNFLHVGLIHLILPKAKIIDVRRHPLGCCFSAFKQHFTQGFDFAYDLKDLGRYYADYVRLMAHFDAALPGVVHRVIYEDLVQDTEAEVRRLLDYLALPYDPACLRFFDNPRAVATPSSEQVRRPIFTDAMDQWRHFEPWLDPLKTALGPVLAAYPSPP